MRFLQFSLLLGTLFFLQVAPAALAQPTPGLSGFWQGMVTFKGAELPIRLVFDDQGEGLTARLDIPSLVYADQPVSVKKAGPGAYQIEFPFGIGTIEIKPGKNGAWVGADENFSLALNQTTPPPYKKVNINFGAFEPEIPGTVYMPGGQGRFPAVVLVAGSGNANRAKWSYASWADFYARKGYAVLIYDRRPDFDSLGPGTIMNFDDQAKDIAAGIEELRLLPEIDPFGIGIVGASRGAWLALAVANMVPDLKFLILHSLGVSTPAEQEVASIITGMDQDRMSPEDIAAARGYLRLYFYVAETGEGWPVLAAAIKSGENSKWLQYVDQPRSLEDLRWWKINMNFPARAHLRDLKFPVLALWGGDDFITPWRNYSEKFLFDSKLAGNESAIFKVFDGAGHRLEIDPGVGPDGNWRWFGMAPGVL